MDARRCPTGGSCWVVLAGNGEDMDAGIYYDAHVAVHGKEHGRFRGKLQAETQDRYVFFTFQMQLEA